jgi:non-ribosomal peptide synthetase component F
MYRGDVDAFNQHFAPSCVIAHGLGPTESFIVCFYYVAHGTRVEGSKLPIGWPVRDKEMLLLDEAGKEVPVGEVGEIHVRSRHIALGYWRRHRAHARAAFLPDPHDPAVRTYRTATSACERPTAVSRMSAGAIFRSRFAGFAST